MKAYNKLFLFLALAATLVFTACGDFDHNDPNAKRDAVLTVSATNTPIKVSCEHDDFGDKASAESADTPTGDVYIATMRDLLVGGWVCIIRPKAAADAEKFEPMTVAVTLESGDNDLPAGALTPVPDIDTEALEDAVKGLEDAIAALEEALAGSVTQDDLEKLRQDLLDAIDALAGFDLTEIQEKIDELLAKSDELLEDVMDALAEMALDLKYRASLIATCLDPADESPIEGCVVVETGIPWSTFPAGDDFARTCTTDATGTCTIRHLLPASDLLEGESLRFRAEAVGYAAVDVSLELPANRPRSFDFRLSADQPDGTLECQDFRLNTGEVREDVLDLTFVWENGVKRGLTADERAAASCMITEGVNFFNIDPTCVPLTQLGDGCGTFEIDINGMKCAPRVRAGDTGFCP